MLEMLNKQHLFIKEESSFWVLNFSSHVKLRHARVIYPNLSVIINQLIQNFCLHEKYIFCGMVDEGLDYIVTNFAVIVM